MRKGEMTVDEMIDTIASDYVIDRGLVEQIAAHMGQGDVTYERLEQAVASEIEDMIAGDDANMEYDFL